MKKLMGMLMLAGLAFATCAKADNEAVWSQSYQLEAARQYADSLAVLDNLQVSGVDAELMMLRRGWLNYQLGQYNDSVGWYKRALERNSESMDALLGLTLPLLAQQRWREAALYAQQALQFSRHDYTAILRLIVAEEGMRDWQSMKKHAEMLAEYYPSDATALVYLARANVWLGNANEARKAYCDVLARSPGHQQALDYLSATGK